MNTYEFTIQATHFDLLPICVLASLFYIKGYNNRYVYTLSRSLFHLAMRLVISHDRSMPKKNQFCLPCAVNKSFHSDARPNTTTTQNIEIFQKTTINFKSS